MAHHPPTSIETASPCPDWRLRATLTVPEAALVLGLGRSAAYDAARRGDLPCLTVGRRRLVPVARLVALLEGQT